MKEPDMTPQHIETIISELYNIKGRINGASFRVGSSDPEARALDRLAHNIEDALYEYFQSHHLPSKP